MTYFNLVKGKSKPKIGYHDVSDKNFGYDLTMKIMKTGKVFSMINNEGPVGLYDASRLDFSLLKKVYQVLQSETLLNSDKINVRVYNRTVYLDGIVSCEKERNLAYEAIVNIFGVRNVVNYLTFPCPFIDRNSA